MAANIWSMPNTLITYLYCSIPSSIAHPPQFGSVENSPLTRYSIPSFAIMLYSVYDAAAKITH